MLLTKAHYNTQYSPASALEQTNRHGLACALEPFICKSDSEIWAEFASMYVPF